MSTLLTTTEASSLMLVLAMTQKPIQEILTCFDSNFPLEVHTRVALAIRIMLMDGYFTSPTSTTSTALGIVCTRDGELLVALMLLIHLRGAGRAPAAGPAIREFFVQLEDQLRRDAIRRKRDASANALKRSLKDVLELDAYRMRNAIKLYLLYGLMAGVESTTKVAPTPHAWMQVDLEELERAYASLESEHHTQIRKTFAALEEETNMEQSKSHLPQFTLCASCPSSLLVQGEGVYVSNDTSNPAERLMPHAERLETQFSRPAPPHMAPSVAPTLVTKQHTKASAAAASPHGDTTSSTGSQAPPFGWRMQFTVGEFPLVLLA